MAETELVNTLGSENRIKAHAFNFSREIIKNGNLVKDELLQKEFDVGIMLRCLEKEKDQCWIPGNIGLMHPVGGFLFPGDFFHLPVFAD